MAFRKKQPKSDFDKLKARAPKDTVQNRDVYYNQQLERSKPGHRLTMRGRLIFLGILGVIAFLLVYSLLSVTQYGAYMIFHPTSIVESVTTPSQSGQPSGSEEGTVMRLQPTEASQDILWERFLEDYFELLPRDADAGRLTDMYVDMDGNEYTEADVTQLWQDVRAGKYLTEEQKLEQTVEYMKASNEYGLLPVSMAPMNITEQDFQTLYLKRKSSGFIAAYYDSMGNSYIETDAHELWEKVRTGALGSGEVSEMTCIGGNSGLTGDGNGSGSESKKADVTMGMFFAPTKGKVLLSLLVSLIVMGIALPLLIRNREAQDTVNDQVDINQYPNDQHIALPEEIQEKFDWFPDAGARCSVQVSSMISHMMLSNKGLKKVKLPRRAAKDIKDEDGSVLYLAGEVLRDDNGEPVVDIVPIVDEAFGDALFDASGLAKDKPHTPKKKRMRKWFDTTGIVYNPGDKNRDKLKGYKMVADMINGDWELPEYEPQRPAGAYLVDTQPVNTMV